ncbi:hypothetical protein AVEN_77983-1 [Araneus ventricosus]|uniref:RNA-directed DNA polymerase n=1 Tax=Araneus ventricosus TaxID=182803 RepID=A0A4Y2MEL1_ARAVE|nr:hypothetical protein AVEN_77983-1 [Araneus ventricosus]
MTSKPFLKDCCYLNCKQITVNVTACERVKYLGHYITSSGIQVDPDKTAAIREMVPPKNVKQVQSFLQTCSWYRRFISNFAEKSRPLSNITKKYAPWKWEEEQKVFNTLTLTQCLTTAPIPGL